MISVFTQEALRKEFRVFRVFRGGATGVADGFVFFGLFFVGRNEKALLDCVQEGF